MIVLNTIHYIHNIIVAYLWRKKRSYSN